MPIGLDSAATRAPAPGAGAPVVRASGEWVAYFRRNREHLAAIPWDTAASITPAEREAIAKSLAEFQLGESSEGRHLAGYAAAYARRSGDLEYAPAMGLFIAEEQRHARDLGQLMDRAGMPRKRHTFADRVFRQLRRLAGLEMAVSVLVTAEIIAQVYCRALRDATACPALRALCRQILRDERAHVQFQCERLAIVRYRRGGLALLGRTALHRLLMAGAILIVWRNHRRALRRGGYTLARFWLLTWVYTERALRIATPDRSLGPRPCASSRPGSAGSAPALRAQRRRSHGIRAGRAEAAAAPDGVAQCASAPQEGPEHHAVD